MLWTADETVLDLFARRPTRGFLTGLRFLDASVAAASARGGRVSEGDGFQLRHVVEVCGDDATPRNLVLLHVIAAFLTRSMGSNDVHGAEEKVFVFDHECELSAPALLHLVKAKLPIGEHDDQREATARLLLGRVAVFRCRDSFQWLATINKLHFDLLDAPPAPILIVINCIGSFHAIDKMIAKSVGNSLALADQVFGILKQFVRHHSPILFAAKRTTSSARGSWDAAEYMPTSWTRQVSRRIQLRTRPLEGEFQAVGGGFEARSFASGKSRVLSFEVDRFNIVEEVSDKDEDYLMSAPTSVDPSTSISITEADTNAAQLWMT